ncbi:O-methyltransferase [Niallia sp. JL1B1071]|uniref:O-methyltransferase n=1 Tax=Niallia tiangongensis TaxID=3237105 RepID=UPI0037DC587B
MQENQVWSAVDHYLINSLQPRNDKMEKLLQNNRENNLPEIDVSPTQGKFLWILAKIMGAKKILEIGTLGGYSTTWLAMALPEDGKIITLENNSSHIKVAKENFETTGVHQKITIMEDNALTSLSKLQKDNIKDFDLIFIDADKPNNPHYIDYAIKLARKGALIIADNIVRNGDIIDKKSEDPKVVGIRHFIDILSNDSRLESVGLQTVGIKGYDGFIISFVK